MDKMLNVGNMKPVHILARLHFFINMYSTASYSLTELVFVAVGWILETTKKYSYFSYFFTLNPNQEPAVTSSVACFRE